MDEIDGTVLFIEVAILTTTVTLTADVGKDHFKV